MGKKRNHSKKTRRSGGGSGGGSLSGLRGGMKSFVGSGPARKKKESPLVKALWYLVMAGAVGFLIYKWFLR